jgi:vitamin B12 transporter
MRQIFILVFLLCSVPGIAQSITGVVKNTKQEPLPGVSIAIRDSYDGGTTDSMGRFGFKTMEKGKQVVVITSVGYKSVEIPVDLSSSVAPLNVTLKEEVTELKAVVITAGSFEASDKKKATVLNPIDIVTTASANADITEAVKTLPGAQQVGESEGLFVRGGTATETKAFIDGTLVNNFYYSSVPNIAQRGRFSPFLFKGTVFSAGGYSALYGQALSSALILESIDMPDQSSANFGISVLGAGGGYQHLAKNKKFSAGINYGYTNVYLAFLVLKQKQDFFTTPAYHTIDANFRIKTSATGIIKYYGYGSANKLGFRTASIDTLGYRDVFVLSNNSQYHNLSFKESLGSGWKMQLGASYANNADDIEGRLENANQEKVSLSGLEFKNFAINTKGNYANAKVVLEKKLRNISAVRFGTEYNHSTEKPVYTLFDGQKFPSELKDNVASVFAETDVYVTNALAARIGSRLEHSSVIDKINIAPRLSLAYKLGDYSQVSVAYGHFYQTPESRYLTQDSKLNYAKATHYIAQYQVMTPSRTLRAEVFYKKYDDLVKTGFENNREVGVNNNGFGDAKGFEIFWRDKATVKTFDYWVSYSYLDTKRDFINFPYAVRPSFAAKHTTSVIVKKYVSSLKTQFNGAYNFSTGRPHYRIANDGSGYKFTDYGYSPDYHNVSLSVNYLPSLGKPNNKNFVVYVLSVSNAFAFKQTYGYQYSYNGYRKEPIVPGSRVFVFVGAFFSFGVDRSQDAINNNLSIRL